LSDGHSYLLLDSHILNPPLQLLKYLPHKPASGLPNPRPIALPTVEPALSGACALTAVIDQNSEEMWVALAGDCRAVAGWWIPGENGSGKWRCDVLTEDQMGKNPNEVERFVVAFYSR
jgi:pyruvate dehydrogenase phosphatase